MCKIGFCLLWLTSVFVMIIPNRRLKSYDILCMINIKCQLCLIILLVDKQNYELDLILLYIWSLYGPSFGIFTTINIHKPMGSVA